MKHTRETEWDIENEIRKRNERDARFNCIVLRLTVLFTGIAAAGAIAKWMETLGWLR